MKRKLLQKFALLVIMLVITANSYGQATAAKETTFPASPRNAYVISSLVKNNTMFFQMKDGSEAQFKSAHVYSRIDLSTHFFGYSAKLGMFKPMDSSNDKMFKDILNPARTLLEFIPDNPHAGVKELKKGEKSSGTIPGILSLAGVKSPAILAFTLERDSKGEYKYSSDITINVTGMGIEIPKEHENFTGTIRIVSGN